MIDQRSLMSMKQNRYAYETSSMTPFSSFSFFKKYFPFFLLLHQMLRVLVLLVAFCTSISASFHAYIFYPRPWVCIHHHYHSLAILTTYTIHAIPPNLQLSNPSSMIIEHLEDFLLKSNLRTLFP